MAAKIRLNDEIVVLVGKDKGKRGKVINVISRNRVIVKGINLVKKHQKPIPSIKQPGGIYKKESSIHVSNIGIFNLETNKVDKIGFRFENGKKIRFFKSNAKIIDKMD